LPAFSTVRPFDLPNFPDLTPWRALAIALAGGGAGFINAIVGSGTLVSFPTMVGLGFDNISANIANNIGLFPGSGSAAYGYRRELAGQKKRLITLGAASGLGALIGAILLLKLPASAFKRVVPFLILIGVVLVLNQPRIMAWVKTRREQAGIDTSIDRVTPLLWVGVFAAGIYGGYFGAAQGVLVIGIMGALLNDELVRINAAKNVLVTIVGAVAAAVFVIRGNVPWAAAGLVAVGSILGAQLGAKVGRNIPPLVLRRIVGVVGICAATKLFLDW
jgi:uncharacterized protein